MRSLPRLLEALGSVKCQVVSEVAAAGFSCRRETKTPSLQARTTTLAAVVFAGHSARGRASRVSVLGGMFRVVPSRKRCRGIQRLGQSQRPCKLR